ncbi:hypothetical protein AAG570_012903 [Ranatra chinensis]|uniref:Potassium channel domain-containing protein n=1 Tax=Ranatra chinensis TaxID=642074 RepID=A0ABD0Z3G4_9HEMI
MRRKRERRESERLRRARAQEPFYLRSEYDGAEEASKRPGSGTLLEADCLSNDASIVDSKSGNFLAPLLLCLVVMVVYIGGGALVLCRLESSWSFLDGVFFCFMVLSTIGFGDSVPADSVLSGRRVAPGGEPAVWFCSAYILCGLALTAMCFSVVHEEIVHRLKHRYPFAASKSVAFEGRAAPADGFVEGATPETDEYLSLS